VTRQKSSLGSKNRFYLLLGTILVFFAVTVAALRLAGYAGLVTSALLKGEDVILFGLFVALVGVLFSGYLTWLKLFEIEAICQWFVASAVLMAGSLLLAALRVRRLASR
jgi:uncharacterized membrane protein